MTNTSDAAWRQLIVQKCEPTPRDQKGVYLDLRISLHSNASFIRTPNGGTLDLSCSTDLVLMAELAKLVELLRGEQVKRAAQGA